MLGFGVGAFAMIVILSTLNGFEKILELTINNYDPEITITASGKKTFVYSDELNSKIRAVSAVRNVAQALEEKVVVKYDQHQEIAKIKGVSTDFEAAKLDSLIVIGSFNLGDSLNNYGVFGGGLSRKLNLFPGSPELVTVFVPRRDVEYNSLNPMASLSAGYLRASGVFTVSEEKDNETFITSLSFAQKLLTYPGSISSLEVTLQNNADADEVKLQLENALGTAWVVKTRRELNEMIYKIVSSEKWFTFAILTLVLIISSFNIFGSLIMLVLDKKKDIGILKSMGTQEVTIRNIFLWQGSYIAIFGGGVGIILATILVLCQQQFGWLQLENAIVEAYPVKLIWSDILLTFFTVSLLGYAISLYPAFKASKTLINKVN